jgi:hypothetical protein
VPECLERISRQSDLRKPMSASVIVTYWEQHLSRFRKDASGVGNRNIASMTPASSQRWCAPHDVDGVTGSLRKAWSKAGIR